MKIINKVKDRLDCHIKKYSFFNNVKYIETDIGNYIIKEKDNTNTFNLLKRNGFDNYISSIDNVDNYSIYPYIDDLSDNMIEKAQDLIYLISNLHNKTSYYQEIDLDFIKEMYEERINKLNKLNNYYEYLRLTLEEKDNLTPTDIYYLKNMSIIFSSLDLSRYYLDKWYKIVSEKKKIRYCLIHNNLDLKHIIENDKPYLISWDKALFNIPIYDFITFYKNSFNDLDFNSLLSIYKNNTSLEVSELYLLYSELLRPNKIILTSSDIKNIYYLTKEVLYLEKSNYLILEEVKEKQTSE